MESRVESTMSRERERERERESQEGKSEVISVRLVGLTVLLQPSKGDIDIMDSC
jgi:hypothetical protein